MWNENAPFKYFFFAWMEDKHAIYLGFLYNVDFYYYILL